MRRTTLIAASVLVASLGISACTSGPLMPRSSVLELEKQGTRTVGDETVELYMSLNSRLTEADKKAFRENPKAVLKKLLEAGGHTVNEVVLPRQTRAAGGNLFISMLAKACYHHTQIPVSKRSKWEIVIVDTPYC